MLSYQHAYHAGNHVDVLKHTLWAQLITYLKQKPTPIHVYETHAGRGLYPVETPEMQKLQEYKTGVTKLKWREGSTTNPYIQTLADLNPTGHLGTIPGSPAVAAHIMAPEDHLYLADAHPQEFEHLRTSLHRPNLHLHMSDGHILIPKLVRQGQRNAVLIDPSYEIKTEYAQVVETVKAILTAAPQAPILVWYPLLAGRPHAPLVKGLKDLAVSASKQYEFTWSEPKDIGLHGTGNILLNTPYGLDATLEDSLRAIAPLLKNPKADLAIRTLTPRK